MKADIIVKSIIRNCNLNRFLIIQRCNKDDTGAGTWENAGGNVEYGEDLEEAIHREIMEETGINDISIERAAYVTLVNANPPYLIIVYLCETKTEEVKLSPEHQAYLWADEEECRKMLPEPIIKDFDRSKIFDLLESKIKHEN